MAKFTVADIKALRQKTGAGMLDVKKALEEAYAFIDGMDPDSEAYTHALRNIKDLEQIQDAKRRRFCPSPDAVVGAVGSFVGIVAILKAEQIFPVASKALGFVAKIRI